MMSNMVKHQLFVSDEENVAEKSDRLYLTVGSSRKDNATPTEYTDFPQTRSVFRKIRSQLLPVLRRNEHFDFEKPRQVKRLSLKAIGSDRIREKNVREFNDKKYIQNCCSRIKRWSIESNFIQWLCGDKGVVECFFCKFWKKSCLFCLVFDSSTVYNMDYKKQRNRLWVNIW